MPFANIHTHAAPRTDSHSCLSVYSLTPHASNSKICLTNTKHSSHMHFTSCLMTIKIRIPVMEHLTRCQLHVVRGDSYMNDIIDDSMHTKFGTGADLGILGHKLQVVCRSIMHLSIVCPTSPCTGIGGAKGGFDCVVYFNPALLGLSEGSIPHFRQGT